MTTPSPLHPRITFVKVSRAPIFVKRNSSGNRTINKLGLTLCLISKYRYVREGSACLFFVSHNARGKGTGTNLCIPDVVRHDFHQGNTLQVGWGHDRLLSGVQVSDKIPLSRLRLRYVPWFVAHHHLASSHTPIQVEDIDPEPVPQYRRNSMDDTTYISRIHDQPQPEQCSPCLPCTSIVCTYLYLAHPTSYPSYPRPIWCPCCPAAPCY